MAFSARRRARLIGTGLVCLTAAPAIAGPFVDSGHDAVAMLAWASAVEEFAPGPMDLDDPQLGLASFGLPDYALGPASNDAFDVVSLGDGGHITLWFEDGIQDGAGDDLAVWENGFYAPGGLFAEFAFVEVSSNGVDFARFPATSLWPSPVWGGGVVDPSDYDNLAGDQPLALGTGFDLAELAEEPIAQSGLLDLKDVRYVRLVDVVGDGSRLDAGARPIYDPFPTPFEASGFDLEAVGVLHPVPEPSAVATLAAGGGLLIGLSRWRARRQRCAGDG